MAGVVSNGGIVVHDGGNRWPSHVADAPQLRVAVTEALWARLAELNHLGGGWYLDGGRIACATTHFPLEALFSSGVSAVGAAKGVDLSLADAWHRRGLMKPSTNAFSLGLREGIGDGRY